MKKKTNPQTETTLSKAIRVAKNKAAYDTACKRILAQKRILAWIMKECVAEFRECRLEDIENKYIEGTPNIGNAAVLPDETNAGCDMVLPVIHGDSVEDVSMTEGTIVYDVRFRAVAPKDDTYITLLLNAEGQKDYTPGYPLPKRGIYYCSRMISSQYGTEFDHGHYEKLKKVYSIWICLDPPKQYQNMITRYEIHEVDMVGCAQEPQENYDLMTLVIVRLGNAEESDNRTLQMLDVLFSRRKDQQEKRKILEKEFDLPMTQELKKEVWHMCNFSDVVEREGMEKGLAQGLEQGLVQARMEMAEKMKQDGMEVEMICRYTGLSREEIDQIPEKAN